jgi:hypothetical protein
VARKLTVTKRRAYRDLRGLSHVTALPDEALAEIGRITVQFAILEFYLARLVHGLLEQTGDVGWIVTSELSYPKLQDLSMSLVMDIHGTAKAAEYREVLREVSQAEADRNVVSHSQWGILMPKGEPLLIRSKYTAKRKKGLSRQRQELTVEDLHAMAYNIAIAAHELRAFGAELGIEVSY